MTVRLSTPIMRLFSKVKSILILKFRYGLNNNQINIEASSICQLKCPVCPHSAENMGIIGKGYLKFENFKMLLEKCPEIRHVELSNWGEIFLNPELLNIIEYANDKNVKLSAYVGVNFNNVEEEMLEALVKYKFSGLRIAIDGATDETYKIYRRDGNFSRVIENIKKVNIYKKKYNYDNPRLIWAFIIFGHNEHEIPLAKKMAKELDMEFLPFFNYASDYSPVNNFEYVADEIGEKSREEYNYKTKRFISNICMQMWHSPQINWDGKLLGCCANRWGDYGNVFKDGLKLCLKSEKYLYAKKMLFGKVEERADIPCVNCGIYQHKIISSKNEGNIFKKNRLRVIPSGLLDGLIFMQIIIKKARKYIVKESET